jgi:eukaryotic-like serine/threonine-protein kinase
MRGLSADDPAAIGRYRIVGVVGAGGMGRVLLGQSRDGRLVAVKTLHRHLVESSHLRTRFRREIYAARAVSGAYTAPLLSAEPNARIPWFASVFVPGPSLAELVTANGPMPAGPVRRLAAGLAAALTEIHGAGLIHRDLKPANVLLTDDGPRVIDFGVVRDSETVDLTHAGAPVGSPAYMSPEQALGKPPTPASDVFSLGSVLYMAATGFGPFDEPVTARVLYRVAHDEPDLSRLPPALAELIGACLAKDPARRPRPDDVVDHVGPVGEWPPPGLLSMIAEQRAATRDLLAGSPPPPAAPLRRRPTVTLPRPPVRRALPATTIAVVMACVAIAVMLLVSLLAS